MRPLRHRRASYALAVLVALGIIALASRWALSGPATHRDVGGSAASSMSGGKAAGSRAPSARDTAAGPFAVGLQRIRLVEPGRFVTAPRTEADTAESPRAMNVTIRYPAAGSADRAETGNAAPASAGTFPLIVFGPGYDVPVESYAGLLHAWARAGYVVAAVAFPLSGPDAPGGPVEADIVNQPADVRFTIDALTRPNAAVSGVWRQLIDTTQVAVAGHSDGGDTALAVAANSCCRDPQVKAVVVLSGAELSSYDGRYFSSGSPPLLAVQGERDAINPPAATNQFYAAAPPPRYLLCLPGADHFGPYTTNQPAARTVATVTADFFDAELTHRPDAPARLRHDVATFGLTSGPGSCPALG